MERSNYKMLIVSKPLVPRFLKLSFSSCIINIVHQFILSIKIDPYNINTQTHTYTYIPIYYRYICMCVCIIQLRRIYGIA